MSDGRQNIRHKPTCSGPHIIRERFRVICRACGRYESRTDVAPGACRDCGKPCRPDMPVCSSCKTGEPVIPEPQVTTTIPAAAPVYTGAVCRGCYQPVTVRVKPGRGFVCPCCATGRAA